MASKSVNLDENIPDDECVVENDIDMESGNSKTIESAEKEVPKKKAKRRRKFGMYTTQTRRKRNQKKYERQIKRAAALNNEQNVKVPVKKANTNNKPESSDEFPVSSLRSRKNRCIVDEPEELEEEAIPPEEEPVPPEEEPVPLEEEQEVIEKVIETYIQEDAREQAKSSNAKGKVKSKHESLPVTQKDVRLFTMLKNELKKRGRPSLCSCPNCVSGTKVDNMNRRHNCHIEGCDNAFYSTLLLRKHLVKTHNESSLLQYQYNRKSKDQINSDESEESEAYVPYKTDLKYVDRRKKLHKLKKKHKNPKSNLKSPKYENITEFIQKLRGISLSFDRLATELRINLANLKNDDEFEELLNFSSTRYNSIVKYQVEGARELQKKLAIQLSEIKALNHPYDVIDRQRSIASALEALQEENVVTDKALDTIIDNDACNDLYSSSDDEPLARTCEVTITESGETEKFDSKPQIRLVSLQNLLDPRLMATGLVEPMPEKYHEQKEAELSKLQQKRRTINIKTKIQSRHELAKCRNVKVMVEKLPKNLNCVMREFGLRKIYNDKGEIISEKFDDFEIQAIDDCIAIDDSPDETIHAINVPSLNISSNVVNVNIPQTQILPHDILVNRPITIQSMPVIPSVMPTVIPIAVSAAQVLNQNITSVNNEQHDVEELLSRQAHVIPRNTVVNKVCLIFFF